MCASGQAIKHLKDECVKYGQVVQLKIPRPADPKMAQVLYGTGFYGKVIAKNAILLNPMR